MFLNHVEVYFEYEHARDIMGIWTFSLKLDTRCMIVTLRTIVSTEICKYGQLFFELKRLKFLLVDIMRAFYPIERGNPCAYEVATRTIKNQLKTRMRVKLQLKRVCSCIKNNKEPINNKNAIHIFNPGKNAQADTGEKFHRKTIPS